MWFEFFKFDLRYQLRQPLLWVIALIFGLMAFGLSSSDAVQIGGGVGNVNRNAPTVIAQFFGIFSIISMFVVTIFMAGAILRDTEIGISDMIFATPMRKHDYLIGRFAGGMLACMAIFVLVALGIMLGGVMPWVDAARVGPFSLQPYLWSFAVIVIPNLLFISSVLMLLAATTRSMLMVYIGVIAFFVLQTVADVLTRDINNEWLAALMDPFGLDAMNRMTRYFSTAESNTMLPTFSGFLLANRALWSAIALALFGATLYWFKPQRADTGRKLFGKTASVARSENHADSKAHSGSGSDNSGDNNRAQPPCPNLPRTLPRIQPGAINPWQQCWSLLCFDAMAVFKSIPFLVMLMFGLFNFIVGSVFSEVIYGTSAYPVTRVMVRAIEGSFSFLLIIIVIFYSGELVFKERQAKIADVTDAMPMPNWVPLLAKCLALCAVVLGFMLTGTLTAIGFQAIKGGTSIEWSLYFSGALTNSLYFILTGMLAIALQVFFNNKFIAYAATFLLFIAGLILRFLHLDHNLYHFAGAPRLPYSDMNGYGHFLAGWSWFNLYWALFAIILLTLAQLLWVRGLSHEWKTRLQLARSRLRGTTRAVLALSILAMAGTGGWIFYNTNVLNHYIASDVQMDKQARYEKLYSKYHDLPTPKITDVSADVAIYPASRTVEINGHYLLQNKTATPLDTLRLQVNTDVETRWQNLPPHKIELEDKDLGFSILRLSQPLAPGANLPLDFKVSVKHRGFTNKGTPDTINLNGTFFNNRQFFPQLSYNKDSELQDRNERRKRGLGEPERMYKLENEAARANNILGGTSDWINFETTVSTSSDQIALAPGYLQKSWEKDGRRYFHYKMDRPMMPFFAYLSANWEVKKDQWKGVPIEIYYDKKHPYNVERMIKATQKSLDYYTANFTPYQHRQVRILEFPNYDTFAQSFANTIPYSESIGFIADMRDTDKIDAVTYVTAHEMAHQWWGHQVIGANVQGATVMMESLSQYFALMVMEKEYGRDKMRRFLRYELDGYLRQRGGEKIEELPLNRVEGQQYIHYQKASLIFYRLRDEIGEEALNRALKRYLQDKAYQNAPFTTSRELLDYIRAETPKEKHALLQDMFEKIVFYDNRVVEASAKKRPDGQWNVTMKLHLAKMEADGKGKETPRAYDEPVEIGIFARKPGTKEKDEKVLFLEKRLLTGAEPSVSITVKEQPFDVGIDPYNKLIDRVSSDNRKDVSIK